MGKNDNKRPQVQPNRGLGTTPNSPGQQPKDDDWKDDEVEAEAEAESWEEAEAKAKAAGQVEPQKEGFFEKVKHVVKDALHIDDVPNAPQIPLASSLDSHRQQPGDIGGDVPAGLQGRVPTHHETPPDEPRPDAVQKTEAELKEAHRIDLGEDGADLQGLPINKVPGKLRKFVQN